MSFYRLDMVTMKTKQSRQESEKKEVDVLPRQEVRAVTALANEMAHCIFAKRT